MNAATDETWRTARKPHDCWWCGEQIEKGTRYLGWTWFESGEPPLPVKVHGECAKAWSDMERHGYSGETACPGDHCRGCMCQRPTCECGASSE